MLLKCPECDLQVSDKAYSCPHCGYPLKQPSEPRRTSRPKRKRLPNGFGQISELKGQNLRKPYRAMVTVGKAENGRPISKLLKPDCYFETYNAAYEALLEYHKNPYDLEPAITMQELYERWTAEYFKTLKSPSSIRTITSAWAYCSSIKSMRVMDVRARHIKGCMENGVANIKGEERRPTSGIQARMKSMFNLMLDYALEYELVDKNYARTFELSENIRDDIEESRRGHLPFSDSEMQLLWDNLNILPYVDVLLVQCYSGFRPQELGKLEVANINLAEGTMVGGMKTEAGTDRVVPIHSKIGSIVESSYYRAVADGRKYLFECNDPGSHKDSTFLTYEKYRQRFEKIKDRLKLNPNHRAHDGRMHFITQAKKFGVDEYAIKYMVGHSITDLTEKVYTKRTTDWLKSEIEKIK